jgi:HEAT repeat protein
MNGRKNNVAMRTWVVLPLVFLVSALVLAATQGEGIYQEMGGYEYGQPRTPFIALENRLRDASASEREEIEGRLLDILKSPSATEAAKHQVSRLLALTATCRSVPALGELLNEEQLTHHALFALEGIPCPEADQLLRERLGQTSGNVRINIISSLATRADRGAVPQLARLLRDEQATARAALAALGRIGGSEASSALEKARVAPELEDARWDARLASAESLVQAGNRKGAAAIFRAAYKQKEPAALMAAGLQGIVAVEGEKALPTLLQTLRDGDIFMQRVAANSLDLLPGLKTTAEIAAALPDLSPSAQILALSALERRSDKSAEPAVAKLVESPDSEVRLVALGALGKLGSASSVPLLFRTVRAEEETGRMAQETLNRLPGPGVDENIMKYLRESEVPYRIAALRALNARRYSPALPAVMKALKDDDSAVRVEAWRATAVLAGPGEAPRLIEAMLQAPAGREQQAAEQAVQAVSERAPDPEGRPSALLAAFDEASPAGKVPILRVLGRLGDDKSLALIRASLDAGNAQVEDAAIRVLAEWPDDRARKDLLRLAEKAETPVHRIVSLRGLVRLAGSPGLRDTEETLTMLRQAWDFSERPDEKRLVLGALGSLPSPAALDFAEMSLADENLRNEAEVACHKIAVSLAGAHPDRAKRSLRRLAETSRDERLRQQAAEDLQSLEAQ